jgi:hypothetical protein
MLYTLDGSTLQEVGPAPARPVRLSFMPFDPSTAAAPSLDPMRPLPERAGAWTMRLRNDGPVLGVRGVRVNAPEVVFMKQHAEELEEQVDVLQDLRDKVRAEGEGYYLQELDRSARLLSEQAAEAKLMAEEMPLIEVRSYLSDVERQNKELFERLVREREMEAETMRLAREISTLAAGSPREARIETLRGRLREIFDLKQENRRREIGQLERQLAGLQERLQERERLRDEIIEERIRQLLEANTP